MGFVERYSLVEHLFWGFSRLTNATLLSQEEALGKAYSALRFLKNHDLQTLSREVGLTLVYLLREPGFGFLVDQDLQTLSRELGLAIRDWAVEYGFGFLMDQHLQMLSREVGLALEDSAGQPGFGLHHQLSAEDCLVACYSP